MLNISHKFKLKEMKARKTIGTATTLYIPKYCIGSLKNIYPSHPINIYLKQYYNGIFCLKLEQ